MDHPNSHQTLMMASFSFPILVSLLPTIPDLPIPGTSSDFSGVWVEDSVEKEGETRKGVWCRRGLGSVWRLKSVFRTDMHRTRVHLFKASGLPFHLLAFTAVGDFTLGKGSLLMIFDALLWGGEGVTGQVCLYPSRRARNAYGKIHCFRKGMT